MLREFPRRAFISAMGALWSLGFGAERVLLDLVDEDDSRADDEYLRRHKVSDETVPWAYLEERKGINGQVSVGVYPEDPGTPIALEGSMDRSRVAFGLSPEEARELGQELMRAANELDD